MKMMIMMMKILSMSMIILLITTWLMSKMSKLNNTNQSMNSIECGFNQLMNKNLPISINFILIMIIFVLFDVEIIILMPNLIINSQLQWSAVLLMFILVTLIYEIKNNNINWMK